MMAWPEGRGVGRENGLRNYESLPSPLFLFTGISQSAQKVNTFFQ